MESKTKEAILAEVVKHTAYLEENPEIEMEISFKEVPLNELKRLAKHYEPQFDAMETLNEPSVQCPQYYFNTRINNRLQVEFRGPRLSVKTTFH